MSRCESTLPSMDSVHEILANERRRTIVRLFAAHRDGWTTVDELASRLPDVSSATDDLGAADWQKTSLRHNHLPLLDRLDVVVYDDDERRARAGDNIGAVYAAAVAARQAFDDASPPETVHVDVPAELEGDVLVSERRVEWFDATAFLQDSRSGGDD